MDREDLRIVLDLFFILTSIIAIILMTILLIKIFSDGGQCVLNPANYYAVENNISDICEHCKTSFSFSP